MSKKLPEQSGDKKYLIIAWILGVAHLVFGGTKVLGVGDLPREFTEVWHFPLWFLYFVGVAQVLGAIGLFTRQLKMPASLAMALIMIGAIVTTIISKQYANVAICFAVLVLCILVFKHRVGQLAAELAAEMKGN